MKKTIFISIISLFSLVLLTGCENTNAIMNQMINDNCKNPNNLIKTSYGGGEFENRGLIIYGKCNDQNYIAYTLDHFNEADDYYFYYYDLMQNDNYTIGKFEKEHKKYAIISLKDSILNYLNLIENTINTGNYDEVYVFRLKNYNTQDAILKSSINYYDIHSVVSENIIYTLESIHYEKEDFAKSNLSLSQYLIKILYYDNN